MIKLSQKIAVTAVIALASTVFGCGQTEGPALAEVRGTIYLDGEPLSMARVDFNPVETVKLGKKGIVPSGSFAITNEDGEYVLSYSTRRKGAVLGEHSVKIYTSKVDPEHPTAKERVPRDYNVATKLKETVDEGQNEIDFELTSKSSAGQRVVNSR